MSVRFPLNKHHKTPWEIPQTKLNKTKKQNKIKLINKQQHKKENEILENKTQKKTTKKTKRPKN